jgi:UDP-glucose 4-epimerase
MKVLVTGASGFVGTHFIRSALEAGLEVVGTVRKPANSILDCEIAVVGSVGAETSWKDALAGVDAVVHLAARVHVVNESGGDPWEDYEGVNVQGTRRLAEVASSMGCKRFVFVSTLKVHGEQGCFSETDAPNPVGPYAKSKLLAESALWDVVANSTMEAVVIRPPLVYGPGVGANFKALASLVRTGIPLPLASISNRRSLISIENLVDLLLLCVTHPSASGEVFLASDRVDLSTPELVGLMSGSRMFGVPGQLLRVLARGTGRGHMVRRLMESLVVSSDKAERLLGWKPRTTPAEAIPGCFPGSQQGS